MSATIDQVKNNSFDYVIVGEYLPALHICVFLLIVLVRIQAAALLG